MNGSANHWDGVYGSKAADDVSWYQADAEVSFNLIEQYSEAGSVIDVGAGASALVDRLLASGRTDLTLLDISAEALRETRDRLGSAADEITFLVEDLLAWRPSRTYEVWHDRAVFHFLTDPRDQAAYVATAAAAVAVDGVLVLGTFAEDGPEQCSGLPTARYTAHKLAGVFANDFILEATTREVHRTPWESEQPFTWVVMRRRQPLA